MLRQPRPAKRLHGLLDHGVELRGRASM